MHDLEIEHKCECGSQLKIAVRTPNGEGALPDFVQGIKLHNCGLATRVQLPGQPIAVYELKGEDWNLISGAEGPRR